MHRRVIQSVTSISQNITRLSGIFPNKKSPGKDSWQFTLQMWQSTAGWFTTGQAQLLFLCSCVCAPSGCGALRCTHDACWLVGVLLCLPQCWVDEWVTIKMLVTNCSAQVFYWQEDVCSVEHQSVQQYLTLAMDCSTHIWYRSVSYFQHFFFNAQ